MSTLASTLTPSPCSDSHSHSLISQRPFHSSSPSSSSLLPLANSHEQLNVMSTPLSHRNTDSLLTHKYSSKRRRSSGSPYSTASSDSNSDDDEDNEVPPTPGDGVFDSLQHAHQVKLASPTPVRSAVRGVELSRFFKDDHDDQVCKPTRPADQILNGNAKSFYPSFGDFLPAVKQQQQEQVEQSKVAFWSASSSTTDNKENSVDQLAATTSGLSLGGYEHDSKPALNPFAHLSSPETDSFTFFPTPGFRSAHDSSSNSTKPTSTSSSLRSPKPQRPALFVAPEAYLENRLPREPVYHQHRQHQSVTLPGFPATPPRTPIRSSYHRPTTSASLAHHGQQHPRQQQQYAVPAAYFSTPTSLPPTPPSSYIPVPASPYYASHGGAPLVPIRVAVSPAPAEVAPPTPTASQAVPYPLSPADTDRIAKLHNGRIPTVQQLAPPDVVPGACQQPIVNTGNQGPMVVQAGDWRCGVCTFVNWRRRKICLRCFPYANDIGNILTIQSQRAATLAGAGAGPSSSAMRTSSAPPLSAHTPTFHVHPAAPPYVSSSASLASSEGVPSAHVAAAAMARSATYPPSRGYGSLALLEQQAQQQSQQQQYRYASTPPATVGRQHVPYTVVNPYSLAYSPSRSNGSPMPSPTSMRFPQHQQQVSRPSPLQHPRHQQEEQPAPSSLPPIIWNDDSALGPQSRFSDSSSSAASAGEHAVRLMARKAAAAAAAREGGGGKKKGEEGVRMFPSLALAGVEWVGAGLGAPLELEIPVGGGGHEGWAPWRTAGGGGKGYVAPGPGPGAEPVLAEL